MSNEPLLLDVDAALLAQVQQALAADGLTIRAFVGRGKPRMSIEPIPAYLRGVRADAATRTGTNSK
jgi:hypothetical protein